MTASLIVSIRNFEFIVNTQFVLINFIIPPPQFSGFATAGNYRLFLIIQSLVGPMT